MGRRKRTPETSKLVRASVSAPSRRQRGDGDEPEDGPEERPSQPRLRTAEPTELTETEIKPLEDRDSVDTQPLQMRPDPKDLPAIEPPDPKAEPWPDATPQPMKPVEPGESAPIRARADTQPVRMPHVTASMPVPAFGEPPEMPRTTAPPPLALGTVENPAHMPGPREIPGGSPDDPAPAPGTVPPGDSRSLRRHGEFALIYRVGTSVITRAGRIGTRGQWRVVEYPTSSAASNSYAKECSRFVSDGFSDYRE